VTNANQEGGTICETPDAIYDGFISGHWQAGGGTGPAEGAAGAIIRLFDEQEPAATDNYGSGDARVHALNVRPGAYKAVITALVQRDAAVRTVLSTSWTFENGDWRWESPLIIARGVLAEDFLTVNRPETGYNAWERFGVPTAQRAEYLTVAKVDVATGSVTQLAFGRDLSLAKWVNSNVIVGYDSSALAYVALRLDGSFIRTVMTQPADGTLDAWLAPQRDDARVMVQWENRDAFSSVNVLTGEWTNFAGINGMNTTPEFAPDGSIAYRNRQDSAQRLVVAPDHGVFAEYFNHNTELELVPNAWSPDSRYVLGVESELANGRYSSKTYRVYALRATNSTVWERTLRPNSDVQWAGEGRLFVYEHDAVAEFTELMTGAIAEAERPFDECCILSFSPDGQFAVVRQGNGAAWEQRCAVIEVATGREMATILPTKADQETVFCGTTSWSEDSSTVLISAGGT
jgi:hypothetical protein